MKTLPFALAFALALTACGPQEMPDGGKVETGPLGVVGVDFPATVRASESLTFAIRYSQTCNQSGEQTTPTARTSTELRLNATARYARLDPNIACLPVYIEKTLIYTDPGTPARTDPFEIIVNGKSYGTVTIK